VYISAVIDNDVPFRTIECEWFQCDNDWFGVIDVVYL